MENMHVDTRSLKKKITGMNLSIGLHAQIEIISQFLFEARRLEESKIHPKTKITNECRRHTECVARWTDQQMSQQYGPPQSCRQ